MNRSKMKRNPIIMPPPDGVSTVAVTVRISKSRNEFIAKALLEIAKALLEPIEFAGATPEEAILGLIECHPDRFGISFDGLQNFTVVLGVTTIRDPQKAEVPQ